MALALDITADELVVDKTEREPRIDDKELMRNWEKVENLPEEDEQTIKKIVSALLVKHSFELAVRQNILQIVRIYPLHILRISFLVIFLLLSHHYLLGLSCR